MAASMLDGATFTATLAAIKDLELHLKCSQCRGPPDNPRLLNRCGHTLCGRCSSAFSGGVCPVTDCGLPTPSKETEPDRAAVLRWDALNRIKDIVGCKEEGGDMTVSSGPASSASVPPSQKDLFDETASTDGKDKESPFASAASSVEVLELDSKRTRRALAEIQKTRTGSQKEIAVKPVGRASKRGKTTKENGTTETNNEEKSAPPVKKKTASAKKTKNPGSKKLTSNPVKAKTSNPTPGTSSGKSPIFSKPAVPPPRPQKPASTASQNLNKRNAKGETLLHRECIKGAADRVRELLGRGATPNTQDHNGWTPLHEVSQRGFTEVARMLLEGGANANVPGGEENATPLHDACAAGHVNVVVLLVRYGAKKNSADTRGLTPGDCARTEAVRTALASTQCNITETELLETSIANLTAATTSKKFVLSVPTSSSLDAKQMARVKEAAKRFNCKVESKLTDDATHLIVGNAADKVIERPKVDYYVAMMRGRWIVEFNWILESLKCGAFVDEEEFQVSGSKRCPNGGPEKSRLNTLQQLPKLFRGCNIYLKGNFKSPPYLAKNEIAEVLKAGEAAVLKREPDPESVDMDKNRGVPYHASSTSLANCSHFIIYQEGSADSEPLLKYNMQHIRSLPAAWLFECIDNFKIAEPFR